MEIIYSHLRRSVVVWMRNKVKIRINKRIVRGEKAKFRQCNLFVLFIFIFINWLAGSWQRSQIGHSILVQTDGCNFLKSHFQLCMESHCEVLSEEHAGEAFPWTAPPGAASVASTSALGLPCAIPCLSNSQYGPGLCLPRRSVRGSFLDDFTLRNIWD